MPVFELAHTLTASPDNRVFLKSQPLQPNRFPLMIFFTATASYSVYTVSGHTGDNGLASTVNNAYEAYVKVQADGDELKRCHQILGRTPNRAVHIFLGNDAKEIAANWYA